MTDRQKPYGRGLVIIPAYNEAQSLPGLISRLGTMHPELDVLIVNDGSTDDTADVLSMLPVRVVTLPCNLGVGGAVQTGFIVASRERYDFAIQVDGDGQHPPQELHKLLGSEGMRNANMVIGSRYLEEQGFQSSSSRRAAIRLFSWMLSALCRCRITDATSGFRAFDRRAIEVLANHYPEDYPEVEVILMIHHAGLRVAEVPVRMAERTAGRSSIGNLEAFTYMIKAPLAILMNLLRRWEAQPPGRRAS